MSGTVWASWCLKKGSEPVTVMALASWCLETVSVTVLDQLWQVTMSGLRMATGSAPPWLGTHSVRRMALVLVKE